MTDKYMIEIVNIIDIIQIDSDMLSIRVLKQFIIIFFSAFPLKISPDTCIGDFRLAAAYSVKDTPTL